MAIMWFHIGTAQRIAWLTGAEWRGRRRCPCTIRQASGSCRRGGSSRIDHIERHAADSQPLFIAFRPRTGSPPMWSYILKRLLLMIPTLLGVLTLTFVVIQFVPGGPVEQALHDLRKGAEQGAPFGLPAHTGVDAQQIAQLKALYGFDKPPLERYGLMLKRFARFDLGQSYFRHQSVWSLIVSKLPVSISIGLWTFFLTYLISVPLGIAKAIRNGSRFHLATSLIVP